MGDIYKMLEYVYPCKDCIVKLQCVTYCHKLDFNESLFNKFKRTQRCSDCGHDKFDMYMMYMGHDFKIVFMCMDCQRRFILGVGYTGPSDDEMRCVLSRTTEIPHWLSEIKSGTYILAKFRMLHTDLYDK